MTRTPSATNPFVMPAEVENFPLLYRALIRPIREADYKDGKEFLKRFYIGIQQTHNDIAELVASVWDNHNPETCSSDLLIYLKDIVGFDVEYDHITSRLSVADLRRLISLAVPLWKERFSEIGIVNLIRLLTGKNAVFYNWFYYRSILGETYLTEEQLGYDHWIIGGLVSYFDEYYSQVRLMDDGNLDEQLLLDLIGLERVSSERIEVALVDFLDQFDLTRVKWETILGTAGSIETDKTFLLVTGCVEHALMASDSIDNYVVIHKFYLNTSAHCFTYFYTSASLVDTYVVEVWKNGIKLTRWVAGSPTVLSTPTLTFPILEELWYKLRISCVDEVAGSGKRIKIYVDGNEVINYLDTTAQPSGGGLYIGAQPGDVKIDNVELYRVPLRIAEIGPSGVTKSANFIE